MAKEQSWRTAWRPLAAESDDEQLSECREEAPVALRRGQQVAELLERVTPARLMEATSASAPGGMSGAVLRIRPELQLG